MNGTNDLGAFKQDLQKAMDKSQESFEKQLSFISAGALGLSMVFLEKIVGNIKNTSYKPLLICGWIFLAGTFIINLLSHTRATKLHYRTIEEISKQEYSEEKAIARIKVINRMNFASVLALLLGITLLIIFVTINF